LWWRSADIITFVVQWRYLHIVNKIYISIPTLLKYRIIGRQSRIPTIYYLLTIIEINIYLKRYLYHLTIETEYHFNICIWSELLLNSHDVYTLGPLGTHSVREILMFKAYMLIWWCKCYSMKSWKPKEETKDINYFWQ